MKPNVASQYNPNGGMYGGGVRVHAELEVLPGVRYALCEQVEHRHAFNPARIKTIVTRSVGRFELQDGLWMETSYWKLSTIATARSAYNALTQHGDYRGYAKNILNHGRTPLTYREWCKAGKPVTQSVERD